MSAFIQKLEDHTKSRSPEDFAEDIALGMSLTGILFVLLASIGLML